MDGCVKCNVVGNLECETHSNNSKGTLRRVNMETFQLEPNRYELRKGTAKGAPKCPYGNHYQWIGYDLKSQEYIRFTKSVFKKLVQ